jgi:hypothetical protein
MKTEAPLTMQSQEREEKEMPPLCAVLAGGLEPKVQVGALLLL